ncbi:hypothetical protein MPER_02954 [Moniliophthora perniciosa FA553]|nr:hypothetical protein MPER_02954 [Moniliophthora perniciosa FA553]
MTYGTFYTPSPKKECPVASRTDKEHEFRAPGAGDVRSVCPALNAMAKHGYMHFSGLQLA